MALGYLRYSHLHRDQVTFVADDDLWLAPLGGGRAARLTSDHAPLRSPRFSPNGQQIAVVSQVAGGNDVYLIDLEAGQRRLSYLGAKRMLVSGWLDDDHVLVASDHLDPHGGIASMFSLSLTGELTRLPWGAAMAAAVGPAGRVVVASPNFRGPEAWKRYRGGMAIRLWVSDETRQRWQRLLPEETASLAAPCWVGDRIGFTSDLGAGTSRNSDGQAQFWTVNPDGSDLKRHTNHVFPDGYVRDATSEGDRVVYHARGKLYLLNGLDAAPQELRLSLGISGPKPIDLKPTERLEKVVCDQTGDGSVLDWRGTAWYLTHRDGPARALAVRPGVRIREPELLGDAKAVWVTDELGEDQLEIVALDGESERLLLGGGELGRVLLLAATPDGARVITASHDGTVRAVGVRDGAVAVLGRSGQGEVTGITISPDSRYVVWREAVGGEGILGRLVGYDLQQHQYFELTRGQFDDFSPQFSPDGRYLYFLSSRTVDPSYDELGFDLSFTNTVRVWVIPLRATDPAPCGPTVEGWRISEPEEKPAAQPEKIVFQLLDAEDRMSPLPVPAGRYDQLTTVPDGLLWQDGGAHRGELGSGSDDDARPKDRVVHYDLLKRKLTVVVESCDSFSVSGDGKHIVVRNGDEVWVQSATSKPGDDDDARIDVDLSRLRKSLEPRAEWRQMFDENARLMRDHFWRADLDGVDWDAACAQYRPLIDRITTHDDLVDVLWETMGELNTSHAYVVTEPTPSKIGWLGAEFGRSETGQLRIDRILPGESSDPAARSPLRAAGVAARPGQLITAIDGQPIPASAPVGQLLQHADEHVIELTLADGDDERRVAVVPVRSESSLRYHEWVARNVRTVAEESEDRVGYVHIPDMMSYGWAQFQRMIEQASSHEAVVVDVRFNGGGHTSQLVLERFARRVVAWEWIRQLDKPLPYPRQGMRGPVVWLTNPYAGSDGDIVTAGAKALGLGPVIGERSWGGVIGIDGRFQLVDGTEVTQPRYAFMFTDPELDLENHGTDPDIVVELGPAEWEAKTDVQLTTAVAEALLLLSKQPASTPLGLGKMRFG